MSDEKYWDVFLSYSSSHRQDVERLALRLEEAGLSVYLDKWRIPPGQPFIPELERALRTSRTCAVIIGPGGARPWQNEEMHAALSRAVNQQRLDDDSPFRVIPVLLPGSADLTDEVFPSFIMTRSIVDFRSAEGIDDMEPFTRLVSGIRGIPPGRPHAAPAWLTILHVPDLRRPTGIAADGSTLFVADHQTGAVVRIEDGAIVKRHGGLLKPHHLVVVDDTVIVTDTHHNELTYLDVDLIETVKSAIDFGPYRLRRPHGLASNYPGEFYITDADNHRVLQVRAGAVVASAGRQDQKSGSEVGEFSVPCGVATSPDCIFVADTYNHRIQVLSRDLRALSVFGKMGHGDGQFAYPVGVASWHDWIVIADEHNKRLQLWRRDTAGLPFGVTCISSDLCSSLLGSPFGLTFNEDDQLLVTDRGRGNILRIAFDRMLADLGEI